MKLKKRNLLSVILCVLCAVLLAVGIGFMLPKNEVKSANAAAVAVNKTTYTQTFAGQHHTLSDNPDRSKSQFGDIDTDWGDISLTDNGNGGCTVASSKTQNSASVANYLAFKAEIVVPANTEYKIKYTCVNKIDRYCLVSGSEGHLAGCVLYFGSSADTPLAGQDHSDDVTYKIYAASTPYSKSYLGTAIIEAQSESKDIEVTYTNDTSSDKTFTAYFGYLGNSGRSGGANPTKVWGTSTLTISEKVKPEKLTVEVDKESDTYDPDNGCNFNFDYDMAKVELSSVTFTPFGGTATNYYNGTGASPIDTAGDCNLTDAGTYVFSFDILNGGVWNTDTNDQSTKKITVTVDRKRIAVPTVLNSTQTYQGADYEFCLSGYDKDLMSVPTNGYTSNNNSAITWDNTAGAEKFTARNAATYTVKFHLDDNNYEWIVGSGGSVVDQTKTITINKKEVTFNANNNPNTSWGLGDAGNLTLTATVSGIANPDFELEYYYVKETDQSTPLTTGINATTSTLDVSQVANTGKYILCAELKSGVSANKNYCITDDKYKIPFEITSGGISFSVINWTYKEENGNASALFNSGTQAEIRYKQDDTGALIKYFVSATIPAGGYLSVDTSYNFNGYKDGFLTTKDGANFNNGCTAVGTYKTRVALISDADHLFKSATNSGSFGGDDTKGWYEIEWEISKGKVDSDYLDNLNKNLQYKVAGGPSAGLWQTYDPENPPQFGNGSVEIRIDPAKYPNGITDAEIILNDKNTQIGEYTATAKFTYDDNYESEGNKQFKWSIGAMVIDVDWTSDTWIKQGGTDPVLDSNNVPYQIRVLNVPDNLKQFIDYKYYIADPNDPSIRGAYIGANDAGLTDLINAPYNASSTNAVYIYVEAVLKSTATQYQLKDNTGNAYPNCLLYKLGATNTLVKVTLSATEMGFGDDKLKSNIISMLDTGTNGELDQSTYVEGIYIYDSANNNLGLLKDFDGTKAAVGVYTIVIKLNAAGDETYTLSPGAKHTFTVKAKAIPVPTVNDITFNNEFITFTDYLGGSWNDYKDIIKVGGTVDGVKNANTPYTATLTLTDTNYCWDYSKGITPLSFSLTANEMTCTGTDTVATYNWVINPYVLDASNWNLKGKNGAVYNIPANLISGLDVTVNYLYHTDKAGSALEDGASLSAGSTYFVKAELVGADAGNFVFKETGNNVSDFAQYKLPQSAMAAFGGKVLSFLKNYWWWILIALAVLILLIILIVVIAKRRKNKDEREEKKRQKEEEKERKEEEKRRREEEREEEKRRREEEREREKAEREAERERQKAELEAEKERQKAELELAKAKQEAELAKMKAEAAAATGLGAAGMAVAAQPQQQAVAQPAQQVIDNTNNELLKEMREQMAELRAENRALQQQKQQPAMQQPQPATDPNALARLEAEMAAMRAENKAMHQSMQQQQQMPMAQPMVMPMQQPMMQMPMQMPMAQPMMPMMQPSYGPMPQQMPAYGGADNGALARVEAQLNALQAQQRAKDEAEHRAEMSAMRAEMKATKEAEQTAEFAALRNQMLYGNSGNNNTQPALNAIPVIQAQPQQANNNPNSMDMLGALVVAALKNIAEPKANESKPKAMEQRIVEVEPPVAVNTPTVYPPDAVVTTTTRVDTTKPQPQQTRSRDDGRLFDVDGFYDSFEGNK